jgi:hypothetical protein
MGANMDKLKRMLIWGGTIIALGTAALAVLPTLYREQAPRPALLATDAMDARDALEPAELASLPWCVDSQPDPAQPPPDAVVYLQFNLPLLYLRQLPDNAGDPRAVPPESEEEPAPVTVRTHI